MTTSAHAISDIGWDQSNIADDSEYIDRENSRWSRTTAIWMVAIYLALFVIRPWEVIAPWLGTIRLERNFAILTLAAVFLGGRKLRMTSQTTAVVGLLLATLVSAVFAWRSADAWYPLYCYLTVGVTYFMMLSVIRKPRDLFFMISAYVATMLAYVTKSEWEYFVHNRHEFAQGVRRLLGTDLTFGEPNAVAMSVVVSMPFWYFLYQSRKQLTFQWSAGWKTIYRAALWSFPLLAALAVFLTNSRAGMVGLGAFAVLTRTQTTGRIPVAKSAIMGLLLLSVLWIAAPETQKERLSTLWDPSAGPSNAHESADGRMAGFNAGWEMFAARPFMGIGIGNFVNYREVHLDGVPKMAHNLPGQILGELGLMGATMFGLLTIVMFTNCQKTLKIKARHEDTTLSLLHHVVLACRSSALLMLMFGLSLHNGLRFNWLWIAAFSVMAFQLARQRHNELLEIEEKYDEAIADESQFAAVH